MKSKVEVEELIGVLEKIRREKYPEIPETLIRDIVAGEFEQQDSRPQAQKATKKLLKSNIKEAYEETITNKPGYRDLNTVSLEQLCIELTNRIYNMQLKDYKEIKDGNSELGASITNLKSTLDWFVEDINKD